MTVRLNSVLHTDAVYVALYDVERFYVCNCELSVIFKENHQYETIEEVDSILSLVGIHVGNFHFNGIDAYRYDPHFTKGSGPTDILCVIPENIRDSFSIIVTD